MSWTLKEKNHIWVEWGMEKEYGGDIPEKGKKKV